MVDEWESANGVVYLLETATRSNSSRFLKAYEFGDSLAALMSSSAKHSAIVLMLRKEASRAPFNCYSYSYSLSIKLINRISSLYTCAQEPDGLVDTSERRNVDGLTSHCTGTTDSGRVFSWTAVLDGVDQDFQWILEKNITINLLVQYSFFINIILFIIFLNELNLRQICFWRKYTLIKL